MQGILEGLQGPLHDAHRSNLGKSDSDLVVRKSPDPVSLRSSIWYIYQQLNGNVPRLSDKSLGERRCTVNCQQTLA